MNIYAMGFHRSRCWPLPLSYAVLRLSFTAVSSLLSLRLICLLSNQRARVRACLCVYEGSPEIESSLPLCLSASVSLFLQDVVFLHSKYLASKT